MLIISKVFAIFCLLYLCGNREYPGSFQNKAVSTKLFFQMRAQVKWEGRHFWSGRKYRFSLLNYLLHMSVMLTIIKVFIILFLLLPVGPGNTLESFKTNQ